MTDVPDFSLVHSSEMNGLFSVSEVSLLNKSRATQDKDVQLRQQRKQLSMPFSLRILRVTKKMLMKIQMLKFWRTE